MAAWGDGAPIVLMCGVQRPLGFKPSSQLFDVNGVSWFVTSFADATTYTAVDRRPYVEVRVPADYAGATVLADLSTMVSQLPQRRPVPRRSAERNSRSIRVG